MSEVTGFGIDLGGLNVKLKEAEDSLIRLKRVGTATAAAINKAFADASQGGIQQMRQNIDNMFSALSKDGGAQKSVEKIGEAMSGVGAQASKSATGIDALIRSIVNGGATYADLMQKINGTGFRSSSTKNSELVKVESQIEENKKKLAELKAYIDNFGKSDGLSEGARREATEIKNTIDMLERKRESLMANIRLQERVASFTPKSEIAKGSSQEYVAMYDRAIKEYTQLWEQADKKVAKQKVAEYKATLNEIMALDKSMYSSDKGGKAGTEDARIVEARYKELMQKKLALENELDQLIARNKENAENKLAQQVENIKKRSDARISAESQRRAVQESNQELAETKRTQKEKLAEYKATLAEMKSLDGKIYAVDTKGNSAERASIEESRRRYEELSARKEAIENELGKKIADIRKRYEAEVQSETAKRLINERNAQEAESKRIQAQKVADYKATIAEMRSLDKSIYQVDSKGTESEKAAIEASRQRYVQLAKDKEALENELGSRVARIRSRYEAQVVSETGKRIVSERLAKEAEAKRELNEARRVAREKAAEERRAMQEKIANYKATLAEMKTLDRNIYQVDTRGNSAEIAAMSESKARYAQLNKEKEAMEQELGSKVVRIRNRFEAEVQSEAGRRAVQTRIQRENEAKREANEAKRIAREQAAEERRINNERLRDYRLLQQQKFSLTGDIEKLGRKTGLSDADKARLDELRRREQELNREIAALSVQLGHKKDSIDREYQNKVLQRTAKRCVQESEIETRESEKTRKQVIREYEKTVSRMVSLKKQMENSSSLASSSKKPADIASAKAAYDEQYRQYQEFDAKRQILENQFVEWLKGTRAKQTAQQLDEDINAIRKRQAEEQAAAAAKAKADSAARQQSYQSYVTSYEGAMRVSNKVFDRQLSENEHIKAIENLTAARKKLNESDADYKKQVEEINKAIQKHEEFLARASRTTDQNTEAARRNTEQQRRRQEQLDRSSKSPSEILATDTTNMTLRQLQNFSASIKATMADLTPRSNEWNQLNAVLQNTNNRITGIKREMGLLRTSAKDASDAVANLGRFMNIAFVAQRIWSFTNSVVKLTGEFEQMQVALKTIVGSIEASNKLWEQTVELASKSPFKATELIKYTRQLAAYRIETNKLHDTTKMLADVSAGLGVDMSRLILAYGQVRAAEYLRGTELRQFTEAGVPMLEELAKHFTELNGKATTTAEVFEMISKRQVAFADVSAVLENMTSEGGPFYKMQEQLANTIKGNIATLKNEVDLMMHEIGQSTSGVINAFLKTLKFLVKNWEYVSIILTTVLGLYLGYQAASLKVAISSGKVAAAVAGETVALNGLAGAYVKAKVAMQAFKETMMATPIGWIIAAITALISIISVVVRKVSAANEAEKERAKEVEEEMKKISEAYEGMRERVESALSVFDDAKASSKDAEIALYDLIDIAKEEYHMTFVVDVKGKSKEQLKEEGKRIAQEMLATGEDAKSLEEQWEKTWSTMLVEYDNFKTKLRQTGEEISGELHGEEWSSPIYESYAVKRGTQEKELKDIQKTITDFYNRIKDTIKKESTDAQNLAYLQMSPVEILTEYLSGKTNLNEEEGEAYSAVLEIAKVYDSIADEIINSKYLSGDKGEAIELFLNGLVERGEMTTNQIDDLRTILEGKLGGSLDVVTKNLTPFQKKFNEFLAKIPDITLADLDSKAIQEMGDRYKKLKDNGERSNDLARFFDAIDPGSTATQESVSKQVKEELDGWKAIKKAYEDAMAKGMESIYSEGEYKVALKGIEFLDPINTYLTGGEGKDTEEKKKQAVKILNDRINLIKKMHKQYLDEFKTFGDDAEGTVASAYKKAFNDAFDGTGISFSGLVIDSEKLAELQKAGEDAGSVFSEAMLAKMKEVEEAGTYIRSLGDSFDDVKEKLKKDEGFVGYIYSDTDKKAIKTQISTMEDLYKYFNKDGSKKKGTGTLTIGYGHALQTLEEAKKYLGVTLSQASAEELLTKDIRAREGALNTLLNKHEELIVTQEQYNQLFNNLYQGGLPAAMNRAGQDISKTEEYISSLDADLKAMGTSFAEQFGADWLEQYKQLPTYAERFAKQLEIAALTTADMNSHIDPDLFFGMKARSAGRYAAYSGDLDVVTLLNKAAVDVSQIDFTSIEGVVAALERLRPIAQKEGEEAVQALEEAIAGFQAEVGLTAKKDADKAIVDKVQKYLNEYDLVVELKKLNISPELAKNLFDVDYINLDGLKTKVVEEFAKGSKDGAEKVKTELNKNLLDVDWSVIKGELGEDQANEVKKTLEEIDKLVRKQREDDAKEFAKFLKNNLDEIKIIQDKGAYNISLSDKLYGEGKITADEYVSAIRRVVADTNSEVEKINLEKFKESSLYIKAMGNLAAYSRDELTNMMNTLKTQLATGAPNMGTDEIKEYYDAITNLVEQYDKLRGPFQENEIAKIKEYYSQQKALNDARKEENSLEAQKLAIEQEIAALKAQLETQTKAGEVDNAKVTQENIKNKVADLQKINGQLVSVSSNVTVISEKIANLGDGMVEWLIVTQGIVNEISNVANASTEIFNSVKDIFSAYGADTDSGGWAKASTAMEMVGGVTGDLTSGLSALASGNIAGAISAVVGMVAKLVTGFAKIHDQKYVDEIERQTKEVEKLSKGYEKLEALTEQAFSITHLREYNKELEENIDLQIAAYDAMIKAEEAKKKTDQAQIDAWNDEIDELRKQKEEAKKEAMESVGAIQIEDYRSQTRAFVDAWVSAFKETGDGLSGLEENFGEFFDNIIAEQASLRLTDKFLEPFYKNLNDYLKDFELTTEESKSLREQADAIMPELSAALEQIWTSLGGGNGETSGSLSELQKGIQGVTEETAQVLEALLNSMRLYVADTNNEIKSQTTYIKRMWQMMDNAVTGSSPFYVQMKNI
jgi:hypothetical protein